MGAVVKAVVGAALIVAAFTIPGAQGLAWHGFTLFATLFSVGASLSLGGIASALRKPQSGSLLNDPHGRLQTIRQAAAPRRVVYGYTRVGGVLSFANAAGLRIAPTDQNQLVITEAGHCIDSFQGILFDDESPEIDLTTGLGLGVWTGRVFVQLKLGTDGDSSFASLPADSVNIWTTEHRQRGCAAAYLRLQYKEALYPNGVPNISFLIAGKPLFDPRANSPIDIDGVANTGSPATGPIIIQATGHGLIGGAFIRILGVNDDNDLQPNGTWAIDEVDADHFSLQGSDTAGAYVSGGQIFKLGWSNNAALVIADYLMDPWIGMGVPYAKIRESVLIAAANVCDEGVTTASSPETTENRYTINGTFETSEQHGTILAQMANSMAGHVTYIGGEWHIIPGAFRLPVMEITDRLIVSPMQVQVKRTKRDLVNGIKGTFPSSLQNFIETDFPAVTGDAYLAEDQGVRVWKDIFLPFTITATTAQRIAAIDLERNRRQISIQMQCSMSAYELQPGDVVEVTHARYAWALETFEVDECGLGVNDDGGMVVNLKLVQTDVDVYGFAVDDYGNLIDPDLLDLLSRTVPFGWSPGMVHRPDSTAATLHPRTDYGFGITQQYRLAADGSINPEIRIAGFMPTNLLSEEISRPRTKNLTATTAASGGFISGGQRYYIAVFGIDDITGGDIAGRVTAISEVAVVDVSAGSPTSDNNTVTIHGLRWHGSTAGWGLLFGTDKHRMSYQTAYLGSVPSSCTVTGPDAQPTSITFKGFNVPQQMPDGYFVHLRGAPDQRFERLRIPAWRALHLGIWGGQVVSVQAVDSPPTQYSVTLGVHPSFPFDVDVMAGRYVMLVGLLDYGMDLVAQGGMPFAEFLIASNTANTLTLETGQQNPADFGFILGAVVVIRTKATGVGADSGVNYIEDTGFGQGRQDLGDQDPNIGGGDDSLKGKMLRILGGTGDGSQAMISGNDVAAGKIYIEGEWDIVPDTTSVFIVTDAQPSLTHNTEVLAAQKVDSFVSLRIAATNLAGEQYFIQAISRSPHGKETAEASSPYRFLYLFGKADGGREIVGAVTSPPFAASLTLLDRYVRGDTTATGFTITALDPSVMPGIEVLIENSGTGGNTLTVVVDGGSLIGGAASVSLADGETILIRARDDT